MATDQYYIGAIHQHLLGTLGIESDLDYQLLRMEVNGKWKDEKRKHVFDKIRGAMDDLQYGMCLNKHMKMFVCHGCYNLVTPYLHSERMVGFHEAHRAAAGEANALDPGPVPDFEVDCGVGLVA